MVDPHRVHLADALARLRGRALYAATHTGVFTRVEEVAEVGGRLRVLDLTSADVLKAMEDATEARALYEGALAVGYPN